MKLRQSAARKHLQLRQRPPPEIGLDWGAYPVDVQAANSICDLFRRAQPVKNLTPLNLLGIFPAALAYLDACVFQEFNTPVYTERLNMLLDIIERHGRTWPLSAKIAEDIRKAVAKANPLPPAPQRWEAALSQSGAWAAATSNETNDAAAAGPDFNFALHGQVPQSGNWAVGYSASYT